MGVNSLPETVTRQRCGCDLNLGPSEPESSTLTTRLYTEPPFGSLITDAKQSAAPPAGCRDDANARCSACARTLIGRTRKLDYAALDAHARSLLLSMLLALLLLLLL